MLSHTGGVKPSRWLPKGPFGGCHRLAPMSDGPPGIPRLNVLTSALGFYEGGADSDRREEPAAGAISTKDGAVTIEFGSGKLEKYEVLRAIGEA